GSRQPERSATSNHVATLRRSESLSMAIPAHAAVFSARTRPTIGMWVSAEGTHSVAADAIGSRSLFMAARAEHDVPARFAAVKGAGAGLRPHPSGRVRVSGVDSVAAHPAGHVTRVAGVGSMAPRTPRRIGLSFDRVSNQEVPAVHELPIDLVRPPFFHH